MNSVDTLLLGRNTYDTAIEFADWPYDGKRCFVVTHREGKARHGERFLCGSAESIVRALKESGAKRVYVDGGQLIQQWVDQGLVDVLTISVIPMLLGQGIRLFAGGFQPHALRLVSSKPFKSGLLQVTYERASPKH